MRLKGLLCTVILCYGVTFAGEVKPPQGANPYTIRVVVSGERLYSAIGTGIMVWDIKNLKKPEKIAYIPAFLACDVAVKGEILFIASLYNGLKILRMGEKSETLATLPIIARRVALRGNHLFVIGGEEGKASLQIFDVSNPNQPKVLSQASWNGIPYGIALLRNLVLVADDKRGLLIFQTPVEGEQKELKQVEPPPAYKGQYAYECEPLDENTVVVCRGTGDSLQLISLENGKIAKIEDLRIHGYSCKAKGNLLFIVGAKNMTVADISASKEAKVLSRLEFPGNAFDIEVVGDIAFVANGAFGVRVIDISQPSSPKEITVLDIGAISFEKAQSFPIGEQVGRAPWLRVDGRRIVDETGKPYRLVAVGYPMVNLMWCEPLMRYRFGDIEGICAYLRSLGVNAVRLAFNPPETDYAASCVPSPAGRYPTPEEFVERELVPLVERFEKGGLYVILDMHGAHDYPTLFGWALRAWRAIAQRFHNDPYIAWYELWQEPFFYPKEAKEAGLTSGEVRRKHMPGQRLYYLEVIKEIRRWDKRHIVMVEDYGPWWRVAEEQWGTVNFRVDPGFDNAIFAKRVAYDNGFSERFREYVTGLIDKWQVPFCLAEIETGGRYNKPEDWFYFIYGWIANEERTIPLQFWAVNDVEAMMADLWAPFVKRWASPPPPKKEVAQARVGERILLEAKNAEGGEKLILKEKGKQVVALFLPPDAPVGSSYRFSLPRPLPVGKYRIRVRIYSDGKPAFPQAIVYRDERGWQYPPDSVLGGWGEDHFYYANHHIVPIFLYTTGWVEWETVWEPLAKITAIEVRKIKGVPYLGDCERPELPTRPISQIVIEQVKE